MRRRGTTCSIRRSGRGSHRGSRGRPRLPLTDNSPRRDVDTGRASRGLAGNPLPADSPSRTCFPGPPPRPLTPRSPLPDRPTPHPGEGTPPPTQFPLPPPPPTLQPPHFPLPLPYSLRDHEGSGRRNDWEGVPLGGRGVPSPGREGVRAGRGDRGVRGLGGGPGETCAGGGFRPGL